MVSRHGSSPPCRWPKWPSPTSGGGPSATWRRAGWWCLPPAWAIPYFTTDTSAALRGAEIEAELLCKGTHGGVDGVYTADPRLDPTATRYDEISFMEVVAKDLRVMDLTAITFCMDNGLPIRVFDLMEPGNIHKALGGEPDRDTRPMNSQVAHLPGWVLTLLATLVR